MKGEKKEKKKERQPAGAGRSKSKPKEEKLLPSIEKKKRKEESPDEAELTPRKDKPLGIPRNVNYYRHLMKNNIYTENDINWVLKLRSEDHFPGGHTKGSESVFSFFGKSLESQKEKKNQYDISLKGDSSQVSHLIHKRIGPTVQKGLIDFETGLRSYTMTNKELVEREKLWSSLPKLDRHEFPTFLPPLNEEKQTRKAMASDRKVKLKMRTAFEGRLGYDKYNVNLKTNINEFVHLTAPGVELPNIRWELSMRKSDKIQSEPTPEKKNTK